MVTNSVLDIGLETRATVIDGQQLTYTNYQRFSFYQIILTDVQTAHFSVDLNRSKMCFQISISVISTTINYQQ